MKRPIEAIPAERIEQCIRLVRKQRVILDFDLSSLYQVPTKRLNEQFRRNLHRFPPDFAFQLAPEEWSALRLQIANAHAQPLGKEDVTGNRSHFATGSAIGSQRHRDPRRLPFVFTEHGSLMAANILNSARAVAMSVYVIRAFVKMREDLITNAAILKRLAEIDKDLLIHDAALRDIYQKLHPLLAPAPEPSKTEIGFHVKEDATPYRVKRRTRQCV